MDIRDIPLDQLHFGHEANPPLNARKVGREAEVETLTASIRAQGLGQALLVREIDGKIYVADGNRRIAAMRRLVEEKAIAADLPVKCVFDEATDTAELALALNIERVAMHEADIYEAFHRLSATGMNEASIASRFGLEPIKVRRMLALGTLHPRILDAWRNNQLPNAVQTVRAFTLAASVKEQEVVFDRLTAEGTLSPWKVKEALGVGQRDINRLLAFVGAEAYVKAGGKVIEDLFGTDHRVSDVKRLKKVAETKLSEELKALTQQGWAWAELAADLPQGWNYNWQQIRVTPDYTKAEAAEKAKLEAELEEAEGWNMTPAEAQADRRLNAIESIAELRAYSAADKKRSGAVVELHDNGEVRIRPGYVKPGEKKATAAAKKAADPDAPKISNALMSRLSMQFTDAAQKAIATDPHISLATLVTGMAFQGVGGYPVKVRMDGSHARDARTLEGNFDEMLEANLAHSDTELLEMLAHKVALALDFTTQSNQAPPLRRTNALMADILPAAALAAALRETFQPEDYFSGVPAALIVDAIREALNEDEARKAGKLKKAELTAFAVANVPPTGWLPLELRTAHYDGPGATSKSKPRAAAA